MKIFKIILFLITISNIFTNCINEANPSKTNCKNALSPNEKDLFSHCCYIKFKQNQISLEICEPVTQEVYDKLDEYIESIEAEDIQVTDYDC